jgi:phage-related minor tail protein
MSETIGSATIEVGVNSSAAEAGMNRIDSAIGRTGRNLDNLGGRGAENMGRVGAGADAAAKRVDAATRNIAGAVERANAALISGKKSGAEYFEELARSRGADVMKLAPLIAQLRETEAAQARAKAALEATAASQVAAAEAARVQAAALREVAQVQSVRDNFVGNLREQIQLFGKSADEVLRYRAAQAGAAGAAEPLILELRQLRDAQDAATEAARRAATAQQQAAQRQASGEAMLANLREQIALQGKSAEEVLRYRAALAGAGTEAEVLIQQLQRMKAGQDAAAEAARVLATARQHAAQTQATGEAFLANLREQALLYGKSADEVLRYRASQLGLAGAAAPLLAQLQSVKAAQDAVTAAARATTEAQRQAAQVQSGKDSFVASLQQQAAAIGKTRVELLELQAAQMGVATQSAPFIQKLREAEQGLNNAGMSARANAAALRGVPAQFTDIIVSLQGGQAPLTVLLQQGGQLKDMFGGAGNAVKALGGYILGLINPYTVAAAAAAALAVAYYQGQAEAKAFALSIAMTGNTAGVTAGQLGDMAKAASEAAGTQGKNAEVLAQLVGTGKVGADQLVAASVAAIRSQKFLGIEVENTVKAYGDLGADPLKATLKLGEQYGYLTLSTYQQIKALENEGRVLEAAKVAQEAYGAAMEKKAKDVEASLGSLSRAWNATAAAAKWAWDKMLDVGREDSLDEKVKKAEDRVKKAKLAFFSFAGSDAEKRDALDAAERDRDSLLNQRKVAALKAEQDGKDQRREKARIEFEEQKDKYLTREEQMNREIEKARTLRTAAAAPGENAVVTEKAIQERIAQIKAKYVDVNNAGIALQIGAVQRLGEVQEEVAKRARIALDMQQQTGGVLALDKRIAYAETVAKMDEEAIQRERSRAQQRLSITATETVSADQQGAQQEKLAALRGQISKADQEILTRRAELSKEVSAMEIADSRAALEALDKLSEARFAQAQSLESQVQAQRDANAVIGMTAEQAVIYNRNLVEEVALRQELDARILDTIAGREGEAASLRQSAAAMRELFELQQAGAMKKQLADFLDPNKAQAFGDALRDAFGGAGSALVKLNTTFQSFAKGQKDFAKQRANAADLYLNGQKDEAEYTRDITRLNRLQAQEQLKGYGDMAGAAAGFFGEQSKGYKVLTTVSQVFHAAELAMTLAELVPKGISAVLSQGQGDPYTAFGRMAAMAALVAGLGVAISGGGSGGVNIAKQRQEAQGTGSVLGDSNAKSESIAHSLAIMEKNSGLGLAHTISMDLSLKQMVAGIGNLAGLLARSGVVAAGGGAAAGVQTGTTIPGGSLGTAAGMAAGGLGGAALGAYVGMGSFMSTSLLAVGGPLGIAIGAVLGTVLGKQLGKLFGTTTSIIDQGITGKAMSLGQIDDLGFTAQAYADVQKKKKAFGVTYSNKSDTKYANLSDEMNDQFTMIITGMGDTIRGAAGVLGLDGAAFNDQLNSFVVDLGKISLKDLTGEEQQKALESVFSKLGDDMARWSVAGIAQFQQVGEGYLETLVRVANEQVQVNDVLAVLGKSFNSTGLGAVKLSQDLIAAGGGLEKLTSGTAYFAQNFLSEAERMAPITKSVSAAMTALGYSSVTTNEQFKALVLAQDLNTAAGQALYGQLIAIAEPFKQAADYAAELAAATGEFAAVAKTASEIASEHRDLQQQLNELTKSDAELLAIQRAGIADVNKALFDQVQAAKAVVSAKDALATAYDKEATAAKTAIEKSKAWVTTLNGLNASMAQGTLSTLTPEQKYAEALAQFEKTLAAANSGDTTAQAGLSAAEQAFLTASQVVNASDAKYAADYARVVAANEEAAKWASQQVDVQQASLDALTAQVAGLVSLKDSVDAGTLTVAQAIAELQVAMGVANGLGVKFTEAPAVPAVVASAAPAVDYSRYSAASNAGSDALAAEVNALREEVKGLRADQAAQTSAVVRATTESNAKAAGTVVAGVEKSAKASAWSSTVKGEYA